VEAILAGVQKIFEGLPIKTIALASQHGGSIKMPDGYTSEPMEFTRLRALDDGGGRPETKIYDDLDTGDKLNLPKSYGGHVWHKTFKSDERAF